MFTKFCVSRETANNFIQLFVNRRAYGMQATQPLANGSVPYYLARDWQTKMPKPLDAGVVRMHLNGDITINLYAINPETQRSKWVAIDADFDGAVEALFQLQWELKQDGVEAALEQSRRGGHLWIFADTPLLAAECRIYIYNLTLCDTAEVYSRGMKASKSKAYKPPKRFAVGTPVRVMRPGIDGVVIQVDEERSFMSQYMHTVQTKFGDRRECGCTLELIPPPISTPKPRTGKLAENIHFHGPNARLNVDSIDNSTNAVTMSKDRVFVELREQAQSIDDETDRTDILARIDALESTQGTGGFLAAYQSFMATASNHITAFGFLLPYLSQMLSGGN
jgi:hypothetical protein